jgi:hypothetical protein
MSDNYGVLGQSTAVSMGTVTPYTCPVGKAAKVKLQILTQFGTNSAVNVRVNGVNIAVTGAMTLNNYQYTCRGAGLFQGAAVATAPDGTSISKTLAPSDGIYYLSSGQTVQYDVLTTALVSMNFQVVGTEVQLG